MGKVGTFGRSIYAVGLAGLCVHQMAYADLRPVLVATWPSRSPVSSLLAYLVNALIVGICVLIVSGKHARRVSTLLGSALLLSFLINHLPYQVINNLHFLGGWTDAFKVIALSGGAFVLADSFDEVPSNSNLTSSTFGRLLKFTIPLGRQLFCLTMIIFGIEHFMYAAFVARLVPPWIPGRLVWTYIAGVALISSGIGIALNIQRRLASVLLGTMIFTWFIILHIPRVLADPYSGTGNEWRGALESLAFSGIAFVIAGSTRKLPVAPINAAASTLLSRPIAGRPTRHSSTLNPPF